MDRLRRSEKRLQDEKAAKERSEADSNLLGRIDQLQRAEQELHDKLDTYEGQDVKALSRNLSETPEEELRKRVIELEKLEKHLNSQVWVRYDENLYTNFYSIRVFISSHVVY